MSHYRVTYADAIAAHDQAMVYGGRTGIVSKALIHSAIGRPYSGYHRIISRKAAAILHALVNNHGFTDGNKRTALLVTELLIRRSGYFLVLQDGERIDDMIVRVAEGHIDFDDLVIWFKMRLEKSKV